MPIIATKKGTYLTQVKNNQAALLSQCRAFFYTEKTVFSEELVESIQKHWGVESNSWTLDVTFNEDNITTKAKNQAHILGRLSSLGACYSPARLLRSPPLL